MQSSLIAVGFLLGLDSFIVSVPLGTTQPSASYRRRLAFAFGLCDGLASLLGWAIGKAEWGTSLGHFEWLGPAAVGSYGLYVLGLAWHSRRLAERGAEGWLAFGLPLFLSLDNLAAGVGAGGSADSVVLVALAYGSLSGCLALLGLEVGRAVATRARLPAEWVGGTALVAVSIALLCVDAVP